MGGEEQPELAEWLKVNEKTWPLVIEATKRPDYFNPLVSQRKKASRVRSSAPASARPEVPRTGLGLTWPGHAPGRRGEVRRRLAGLLACHRLGRLLSRGAP